MSDKHDAALSNSVPELAALRETVRVLGEECKTLRKLVYGSTSRLPDSSIIELPAKDFVRGWYLEAESTRKATNANPGARAAVQS
jgi:hypothetical protein